MPNSNGQENEGKILVDETQFNALIGRLQSLEKQNDVYNRDRILERKNPDVVFLRKINDKYIIKIEAPIFTEVDAMGRTIEKISLKLFSPKTKKESSETFDYLKVIKDAVREEMKLKEIKTKSEVKDYGLVDVIEVN